MSVMRRAAIHAAAAAVAIAVWSGPASIATISAAARQETAPTFSRDVAPIFDAKCVSCHRPGEVAPMSLLTFRDARPWAASIREKVLSRAMPPWHADPEYGTFRNNPSLTGPEIDTIVSWVSGGAREGDPAERPPLPAFAEGWQIGQPDMVFEMPVEYDVPARGTIDYQYFEVPTNFTEDRWMQAGEVRAGDRQHVHHIIVYVRELEPVARPNVVSVRPIVPAGQRSAVARAPRPPAAAPRPPTAGATPRGGDTMLVNWAVGEDAPVYLPGTAKRIPAGSTLVFQVHYTTDGTPGRDRSRLGLIFAKEAPAREIRTGIIANAVFAILPGDADQEVAAEATFAEDVNVWTMHPHMHLRGKDMTYTAIYPDGRREMVLRVPKYDFGWQTDYWLAEPLALPKGSTLHVSAHFDNSAANRNNPDPTATVRWGDQTWEEMMIGFFTYTVEGATAAPALQRSASSASQETPARRTTAAAARDTPRTPWGEPDLQGTWTSEAELSVPFERPRELGERQLLTDAELADRESRTARQLQSDNADFDLETADRSTAGQVGSATSPPPHWLERGRTSRRTSLVIDPPDGRIPPATPEAQRRAQGPIGTFGGAAFGGPQDLSLWDRCISRGLPGAIFPTVYNANTRIVQGPGFVAITYEMIHDTRIIPTDGRPHVSSAVRGYFGDSRGRWEGDTLVVDVTNFSDKTSYRGARDTLHLVERFTRVGDGELRYAVTVDDPRTWTRPWTAALDLTSQPDDALFEYACHEGNYAMRNILSGARAAEAADQGTP